MVLDGSIMMGAAWQQIAGAGSLEITSPPTNRKQNLSWKWDKALSKPVLSDVLPTVRKTF